MPPAGLDVPVVFLVFNRSELTARVFARIREARPARLFIVADGPRLNRPGEAEKCRQVRDTIEQGVDWPCEVVRDYADTNLGCARRVSSGITRAFEQVERAIILEDDCLPDPTFFPFCAELLERYEGDERIAQIAGCSFRPTPPADGSSYSFSRYPHCWGWATWRRAWRTYDHAMTAWTVPARQREVLREIEAAAERKYWRHAFSGTLRGRHDSWAYRWTLSCWDRRGLSAVAAQNLVSNIGYGEAATHTDANGAIAALPTRSLAWPLRHPSRVERDPAADAAVGRLCFRRPFLLWRCWHRFRRLVS